MNKKLSEILKNNTKWPLIIQGASGANFPEAIIIPAEIPSADLGIIVDENGLNLPFWVKKMKEICEKNQKIVLCIENLDKISAEEQEKFCGMLKFKAINGFNFPENTQILITAGNVEKISKKILNLALIFKMEQ